MFLIPTEVAKDPQPSDSGSIAASDAGRTVDDMELNSTEEEEERFDDEEMARTKTNATARTNHSTTSTVMTTADMSPAREVLFVAVICLAQFMTQGGLGNCLNILHIIGAHYDVSNPAELAWLIAGYSLTVGTFILVSGRFGDVFGYKRMLVIGFTWFAVWTAVAGLASYSNEVLFIFARVMQGIGPATVLPNGLAILGSTYKPGPKKAMAFAMFGACAPGGSVVAAVFAGLFVNGHDSWWPWAFYSFAIALAAIAVLTVIIVPDPPLAPATTNMTPMERILELDPLGAVTGVTALVLINFAWNQGPIVGWDKPYVYVLLIVGVLFVPAFFYVELRVSRHPLVPFHALTGDVALVLGCVACGWACFGVWVFYVWQFFQILRGASPLLTAAWMSPVAISGAIASVTTGWLLARIRPGIIMLLALTFFTLGNVLIMTAPIGQSYWLQSFFCILITPWGMDMSFPAATLILSNAVERRHQGIAASLVSTVVNYSISIGLGIAGTVEVHVNNEGKTTVDLLYGYRASWYTAVGLSGLGMIISLMFVIKGWRESKREKGEKNES